MNFVALDVETAVGNRNSICQIGIVTVENGKITNKYSRLIQPPGNEYFYRNIDIHGITPADTKKEPTFDVLWPEIKSLIGENLIVAHNAAFDIDCLKKTLTYYNLEVPDFKSDCTYKRTGLKLNLASEKYGIKLSHHHDALADSMACAEIYLKIMNSINE